MSNHPEQKFLWVDPTPELKEIATKTFNESGLPGLSLENVLISKGDDQVLLVTWRAMAYALTGLLHREELVDVSPDLSLYPATPALSLVEKVREVPGPRAAIVFFRPGSVHGVAYAQARNRLLRRTNEFLISDGLPPIPQFIQTMPEVFSKFIETLPQ